MIAALTLAVALTLPQGAETIRISSDLWPERQKVERLDAGERVWWWSADCAPQLVSAQDAKITCAPQRSKRVQVRDRATNETVAGARVIWATDAMLLHLPDAFLPFAITDDSGNAELRVPADDTLRVRVDGPESASWWQTLDGATTRIVTVPAETAVVQVTPSSRAVAELELPASDIRSRAVARNGRITLPTLPPVPMTLAAWSDDGAPVVMNIDGAQPPRAIELPRGASIEGRIVDMRRRPIEGASIESIFAIGKLPRGLRRSVQSNAKGLFVLRGVPLGPVRLQFSKPELATIVRGLDAEPHSDLGNITLRSARAVAVRVVDILGSPIHGATVHVVNGGSATTNSNGDARLDAIAAGDDAMLRVTARGFSPAETMLGANANNARVVLSRGVRVTGLVVDNAHSESAGAGDILLIHNGSRRLVPFENGTIDISGLDAGTLALEIRTRALAPLKIPERTLVEGELWDLGTLEPEAGNILAGRVLGDQSEPLAGARIRTLRPNEHGSELAAVMNDWIETRSGDDGTFRIGGVGAETQQVLFDAAGFAPRMMAMEPDAESLDVRLDRARGLIVECAPIPRCNAEARLLYAGALHPWATASAQLQNGIARIASAAPGDALLRLVRDGHVVHERTVRIGATPETHVQIELTPATLHGVVMTNGRARRDGGTIDLRAKLSAAAGMPVFLEQRTEDGLVVGEGWAGDIPAMRMAGVDEAGAFVFDDLEPGNYDLIYRLEGRVARTQQLHLTAGLSRVTIDVAPGSLHGRVLQPDGNAARFAPVRIIDATGNLLQALCDQLGRFDAIGIANGRALVSVETEHGSASAEVSVTDASSANVELVLRPRVAAAE